MPLKLLIRMVRSLREGGGEICRRLGLGEGLIGIRGFISSYGERVSFNSTLGIGLELFLFYVSGGWNCSKQNAQEGNESG